MRKTAICMQAGSNRRPATLYFPLWFLISPALPASSSKRSLVPSVTLTPRPRCAPGSLQKQRLKIMSCVNSVWPLWRRCRFHFSASLRATACVLDNNRRNSLCLKRTRTHAHTHTHHQPVHSQRLHHLKDACHRGQLSFRLRVSECGAGRVQTSARCIVASNRRRKKKEHNGFSGPWRRRLCWK